MTAVAFWPAEHSQSQRGISVAVFRQFLGFVSKIAEVSVWKNRLYFESHSLVSHIYLLGIEEHWYRTRTETFGLRVTDSIISAQNLGFVGDTNLKKKPSWKCRKTFEECNEPPSWKNTNSGLNCQASAKIFTAHWIN